MIGISLFYVAICYYFLAVLIMKRRGKFYDFPFSNFCEDYNYSCFAFLLRVEERCRAEGIDARIRIVLSTDYCEQQYTPREYISIDRHQF